VARAAHQLLPSPGRAVVGEVVLAVLLGLVLGNALKLPALLGPGIRFSFTTVLRTAIVLLGASFSAQQVAAIGGKAVLMIVVLMAIALVAAHALGRLVGVPAKLATLIGVGTAVCGNSAIIAVAPVIEARDEDVSFAIATNTLFGTLCVFLYPLIGRALGLSDAAFGTWAGAAVNDTSQVVAAGFAFSESAGQVSTAVKLTRNALMGPVIVLLGILYARGTGARAHGGFRARLKQSVPLFVLGFLAMAALNSLGVLPLLSSLVGRDLARDAQWAARFLILIALAGVGYSTRIAAMRKAGLKPLYVGLVVAAATSAACLLWIRVFGPATG
ncbi:MAG: putative sulfate exporter family transporter, partial [Tepidisphaeraceae bacterium]